MEEQKLAALKLTTSEEIICYVVDMIDHGTSKTLIIRDPLKVEYRTEPTSRSMRKKSPEKNYLLSPWFIMSRDREHEISLDIILGISAIHDDEIRAEYTRHFIKNLAPTEVSSHKPPAGYLGSVEKNKTLLEKLYKLDSYKKTE